MSLNEAQMPHTKGEPMQTNTRQFKLNMPLDLMDSLKEIAVRESRSVTAQINLMLRKQVEADQASAQK
jgi:hypothetical protein